MQQPFFDGGLILVWLGALWDWLRLEFFTPAHIVYTAMQIPALVCTGFIAWWLHDFVHPQLVRRILAAAPATAPNRPALLTLAELVFPLLWIGGLVTAGALATHFGWPTHWVRIGVHLLAAWIAIRLFALFVREPVWARAVVIAAYSIAVLAILGLLDPTLAFLDQLAIQLGSIRLSLLTVVKSMFFFGVALWAAVLISRALEQRLEHLPSLTPSVRVLFGKLFTGGLITLAVLVSLAGAGVDFTALAVFGGAVGVGIGFGLQRITSNLISGIMLLMDRSIKPGDIIQIGETYGWVASLGARYVSVETRDGTEYLIPNEELVTHQVVNWSHRNDLARLKVRVRVSYDTDVRQALRLMVQAAGRPARVLADPEPRALLLEFGDSFLLLELRFWICDVQNGIRNISSDVRLEIWDLFRQHGIALPIPQQGIHIDALPPLTVRTAGPPPPPL
ncbi:MAG TPA: mechanosensitive ion channel [Candidatus Competibacteraceae bacterium]|nr:mechanosensitive ion channel [Candidatus Competibacteraceae bacterium]HQA27250.1 mechanosensitive ion channel [Candidatus Competibacteraceae bacterium]